MKVSRRTVLAGSAAAIFSSLTGRAAATSVEPDGLVIEYRGEVAVISTWLKPPGTYADLGPISFRQFLELAIECPAETVGFDIFPEDQAKFDRFFGPARPTLPAGTPPAILIH